LGGDVQISIVICTLNRRDYLRQALESLAEEHAAGVVHEVLVVDNGSDDGTLTLAETFRHRLSTLRVIEEPMLGLSHARNRGVAEARGELVAFLDDDAVAQPGWLEAVLDAFRTHPQAVALGGRVDLLWPGRRRPRWLPPGADAVYAGTDFGTNARRLAFPEMPVGANMAFRKAQLARLGGFDPRLGRRGTRLVSGEEQALFAQMAEEGLDVWYEPHARVEHHVIPNRVNRRWFVRRAYYQGWSMALSADGPAAGELVMPPALRGRQPIWRRIAALSPVELVAKSATRLGYRAGRAFGRPRADDARAT
jgi:glycosyltransferase involved in cell wall biosynthesis